MFKDPELLYWFQRIVRSHRPEEGRGLPIGSLTSQHFANFHLAGLDSYCQRSAASRGYVRYMDDLFVGQRTRHRWSLWAKVSSIC